MFDIDYAVAIIPALIRASAVTILATIAGTAIAIVLGALIAAALRRKSPVATALAFLVDFIRTTPLLIQLFFVFYVFPIYGITLPASVTGALVLGVHYASYLAEVYRAGIDAIPNGQWEAARARASPLGGLDQGDRTAGTQAHSAADRQLHDIDV